MFASWQTGEEIPGIETPIRWGADCFSGSAKAVKVNGTNLSYVTEQELWLGK